VKSTSRSFPSFALADPDRPLGEVDVASLDAHEFGYAASALEQGPDEQTVDTPLPVRLGEDLPKLVGAQDLR